MKSNPIKGLFLHSICDFIVIVATSIFLDERELDCGVLPIPEITILPPLSFLAHPMGLHVKMSDNFLKILDFSVSGK